jgi:hypothetical protein
MAGRRKSPSLSAQDLSRWKLVADFQERLSALGGVAATGSFADPRRQLDQEQYLGLMLFGLLNPVVESMRGLCAASRLERVQEEICGRAVSLGSFSEAQAVVNPQLLERVFQELAAERQPYQGDPRLAAYRDKLLAIDGTIWAALPKMTWAFWRSQPKAQSALKAHVKFNLLEEKPVGVTLSRVPRCERAVWREHWQPGEFYVGDRYYGEDYKLFGQLQQAGCSFVLRLRQEAVFTVLEEYALSAEDRAAGVSFDGLVQLGCKKKYQVAPLRLVRVPTEDGELLLVSDQNPKQLSAELIALIYRYRWRIELFFKWLKCILGCRHWLAQSPRGVAVQVYCALIAALLLLRATGRRPGKRAMEMIRFYLLGYASLEELTRELGLEKKAA